MHFPPAAPKCEKIAGKRILFIMAIEDEYGPNLRSRFTPLMTGVGPIEAAISTTMALQYVQQHEALPDLAVSLGSAGSRVCNLGEVYQVASVSWRDMNATRLGFEKGVTPFLDHPVNLPLHTPLDIPTVRLSTGANIVGGGACPVFVRLGHRHYLLGRRVALLPEIINWHAT